MLLDKYEPKRTEDMLCNKKHIIEIKEWMKKGKGLLAVRGSTGCGKTLAVRLVAKELDLQLIEYANDDLPNELLRYIQSSGQQSLFAQGKVFLIENADLIRGSNLKKLVVESSYPVIAITENPYRLKIRPSKIIKFDKIRSNVLARFLENICIEEKIDYDKKTLSQLAKMSNGDVRAALIDLETLQNLRLTVLGWREFDEDIFNALKMIFKTTKLDTALMVSNEDNMLVRWIQENIPEEYTDIREIANAYNWLSRADIFASRILRQQSWSLQKYVSWLSIIGVALSKEKANMRFVRYRPPKFHRFSDDQEETARKLHISKRKLPLYRDLIMHFYDNHK